jgi:hypothetical protein
MHRIQLRITLQTVWRMGYNLSKSERPNAAAMEKWTSLTSALIRKYMGDENADFFLVHDGDSSFTGRMDRLEQLMDKPVDFGVELQADFDLAEALESFPTEWTRDS